MKWRNISSNHHLQLCNLFLRTNTQLDLDARWCRLFWSYIIDWRIACWITFSCILVHLTCTISSGFCKKIEPTEGYSPSIPQTGHCLSEMRLTPCAVGIAVSIIYVMRSDRAEYPSLRMEIATFWQRAHSTCLLIQRVLIGLDNPTVLDNTMDEK